MMRVLLGLLFLQFISSCKESKSVAYVPDVNKVTIAFGSCNDEDKPQLLWDEIVSEAPDLWIWLGDNIYGDTKNMAMMRKKYQRQKSNRGYKALMNQCPIIGTWDDHDYGVNNGGKEFTAKAESQQAFLDFLDIPKDDPRRSQEGVYGTYVLDHSVAKVKVFLLDNRYHRDELLTKNDACIPNLEGKIMDEKQWNWLEQELKSSTAEVNIIASGIQVIPEQHRFEKWANYPNERKRLFDLITRLKVMRPIFISGDRHIGEISAVEWEGSYLYDITSSSLTHGWFNRRPETNEHRVGDIVYDKNYGVIEINKKMEVVASIKTEDKLTLESLLLFE